MEYLKMLCVSPYIHAFPNGNNQISIKSYLKDKPIEINKNYLSILKSINKPIGTQQMIESFGLDIVHDMIEKALLVDPETIWQQTNVKYLEIEISTHCNWRCDYCPVKIDPKVKKTMSMELFNGIIDKAERHKSIKSVTINSYNEPTLDTHFEERILKIAYAGLKLMLFTNGSMLDKNKIKLLKELDVLDFVQFSLPSLDEDTFKTMTGSPLYEQTIFNIDQAVQNGLNVNFSIKGTKEEQLKSLKLIKSRYGHKIKNNITVWETHDRAGILNNKYAMNIHLDNTLYGCERVVNWIHIGVNGDCFICCEDYYQKEVYGNITDGEIDEILASPKAIFLRKQVFGVEAASGDFICRKCFHMHESKSCSRLLRGRAVDFHTIK